MVFDNACVKDVLTVAKSTFSSNWPRKDRNHGQRREKKETAG